MMLLKEINRLALERIVAEDKDRTQDEDIELIMTISALFKLFDVSETISINGWQKFLDDGSLNIETLLVVDSKNVQLNF